MSHTAHPYLELLAELAAPPAVDWLTKACERVAPDTFAAAYAGCGRRFGGDPVLLSPAQSARVLAAGLAVPEGWPRRDLARSVLLLTMIGKLDTTKRDDMAPGATERAGTVPRSSRAREWLGGLFRTSDNAEREALLKTLPLLAGPERFVETAVEACRTHVQSVFEAIACENPYPARFFPELKFNQLVLKAFFLDVPVRRIVGLAERKNPDLVRMAHAYASERRAAGRSVPSDLGTVTDETHAD